MSLLSLLTHLFTFLLLLIFRCILGELFRGAPIFKGNTEHMQLDVISKSCGTPTISVWPEVIKLPQWNAFKPKKIYKRALKEQFT